MRSGYLNQLFVFTFLRFHLYVLDLSRAFFNNQVVSFTYILMLIQPYNLNWLLVLVHCLEPGLGFCDITVLFIALSQVLKDSPCRLVSPKDAPSREMQRVYRMLDQEYEVPKKILELNRRHPLIQNLAHLVVDRPEEPLINIAIEQLYENGLLIEGLHPNPAAMAPRIQSLLEAAVASGLPGQ